MTISANIKDSMWELGVLRSMGCTRAQILRVMIYELVSNTLSAVTLGYIAGIVTSILAIAQIFTYTDMPLHIDLPYTTMEIVFVCGLLSLYIGAKYGTTEIWTRSIASILKGC